MSWEPPAYVVRPTAQAIAQELAAIDPQLLLKQETAERLAKVAILASRQAILVHPLGKRHT